MALLTNKEILKKGKTANLSLPSDTPTNSSASPTNARGGQYSFDDFNLEEGLAGEYAVGFFNHITSATKVKAMSAKKYEDGRREKQKLSNAKRLGGGTLFHSQHLVLDDEVLEARREKDQKKADAVTTVIANKIKAYKAYEEKYSALMSSNKGVAQYLSLIHI